jgi:hypothetical protein
MYSGTRIVVYGTIRIASVTRKSRLRPGKASRAMA